MAVVVLGLWSLIRSAVQESQELQDVPASKRLALTLALAGHTHGKGHPSTDISVFRVTFPLATRLSCSSMAERMVGSTNWGSIYMHHTQNRASTQTRNEKTLNTTTTTTTNATQQHKHGLQRAATAITNHYHHTHTHTYKTRKGIKTRQLKRGRRQFL